MPAIIIPAADHVAEERSPGGSTTGYGGYGDDCIAVQFARAHQREREEEFRWNAKATKGPRLLFAGRSLEGTPESKSGTVRTDVGYDMTVPGTERNDWRTGPRGSNRNRA